MNVLKKILKCHHNTKQKGLSTAQTYCRFQTVPLSEKFVAFLFILYLFFFFFFVESRKCPWDLLTELTMFFSDYKGRNDILPQSYNLTIVINNERNGYFLYMLYKFLMDIACTCMCSNAQFIVYTAYTWSNIVKMHTIETESPFKLVLNELRRNGILLKFYKLRIHINYEETSVC